MPVLQGQILGGGVVFLPSFNIPSQIKSFTLVNTGGGINTVYISIYTPDETLWTTIYIADFTTATSVIESVPITILAGYKLLLNAGSSTDYYFTIE